MNCEIGELGDGMIGKYSDIFLARIDEIKKCLEEDCYIAAFALALTLPDICGKAEYNIAEVKKRYTQWYDNYVGINEKPQSPCAQDMPYMSGEVVYSLRNNFLHAGNPNIEKTKITEINCQIDEFRLKTDNSLHGDTSYVCYGAEMKIRERQYAVDIRMFCMKLCKAAREYYLENKEKFNFFRYVIEEE